MSLRPIVKALGGELYDRGRRANIPGPGHSPADRSVSLLLQGDRVVAHSFGAHDWRQVLDYLRSEQLIDARNAVLGSGTRRRIGVGARESPGATERRATAQQLWEAARPLPGSLSETHCRLRGVVRPLPGSAALRHHGEVPVSIYRPGPLRRPALLAGILDLAGQLVAVEITYLAANGTRALDLKLPRKTVGALAAGSAVRLDVIEAEMLVGEGVFTTLSASEWFGLPGWALLSTRNVRAWSPPKGVRSVLIAADRGQDGEASAEQLRTRLAGDGISAAVALPPSPFGDWNDWSVRRTGSGRKG